MMQQLLHWAAEIAFPATGQHRAPQQPSPLVPQRFVDCPTCEVSTAATVHGTALLCTEGHLVPAGGV